MSYLRYMCLFAYSGVQHILCCVFVFFVLCTLCCRFLWILRLVYPMLPVSLDSSSCVPYVAGFSGFFVLCTLCCWFLWILRLVYPMLPVSLDCPFRYFLTVISCVFLQEFSVR
jgi:hypothetical protein